MEEKGTPKTKWIIKKYKSPEDWKKGKSYASETIEGNLLLEAGVNRLWELFAGEATATATAFNNSNAHLCVGDGTAAAATGQTDLQGTNKTRKGMDSGYPTYGSDMKITFYSTFGSAEANHGWQEFGVANASSGGVLFDRKVEDKGTKASPEVWTLQLEISLS